MVVKPNYMLEHPKSLADQSVKLAGIGQSAGKSFSYLLGVYLGDGCVTTQKGRKIFRLNTKDEDFAIAVKNALADLTDSKVGIHKCIDNRWSKPCVLYNLRCGDSVLAELLQRDTLNKNKIPDYVFSWDKKMLGAFISGLMDSEGYVAENKTIGHDCTQLTNRRFFMGFKSCDEWVESFFTLLHKAGIRTSRLTYEKPLKTGYKIPKKIYIKMQSWIDSGIKFNIQRKQDRVNRWAEFGAYTHRAKNPKRLTSETICLASQEDDIVRPVSKYTEGDRNVLSA